MEVGLGDAVAGCDLVVAVGCGIGNVPDTKFVLRDGADKEHVTAAFCVRQTDDPAASNMQWIHKTVNIDFKPTKGRKVVFTITVPVLVVTKAAPKHLELIIIRTPTVKAAAKRKLEVKLGAHSADAAGRKRQQKSSAA